MKVSRLLVRVSEAAEICSMSRSSLYEAIKAGEFPAIRIGHSLRVPVAALEEWIRNKAAVGNGDAAEAPTGTR